MNWIERAVETSPQLKRGQVWCRKCGATQKVDSIVALSKGWPKCCGYTMTIDAPEDRPGYGAKRGTMATEIQFGEFIIEPRSNGYYVRHSNGGGAMATLVEVALIDCLLSERQAVAAALAELCDIFETKASWKQDYSFVWQAALDDLNNTIAAYDLPKPLDQPGESGSTQKLRDPIIAPALK